MNYPALEHPARYFILYLLSKRRYLWKQIVALLLEQNMPAPWNSEEFLKRLEGVQRAMQFPVGYNPHNLKHAPTAEWLKQHRIYDIWAGEPEVSFAIDILDQPSLRRELEVMLMGPLRYGDIAKRLVDLHGLDPVVMNVATVRYYAHYFWNVEAVPAHIWPLILNTIPNAEDYRAVFKAPRSSIGASMSVYIATKGGSGVPKEPTMFRYLRDSCFMEFIKLAATKEPGTGKSIGLTNLITGLIQAQEQVDMRRGGSAELIDEMRRLEQRYDDRKLTSAVELPLHHLPVELEREKENAS